MTNLLGRMKLSAKLLLAPVIVVILLGLLVIFAYVGLSVQKNNINNIFERRFSHYQKLACVVNEMSLVHANIYRVIGWAGANFDVSKIEKLGKQQVESVAANINILENTILPNTPDEVTKVQVRSALVIIKDYGNLAAETVDFATTDVGTASSYMSMAETKFQLLNEALRKLLEAEDRSSNKHFLNLVASFDRMLYLFTAVLGVAVALSLVITKCINRWILESLGDEPANVVAIARSVSEGDLTMKIDLNGKKGNSILAAFKAMVANLNIMVGRMDKSMNELSFVSTDLSGSAERVVGASHVQAQSVSETSNAVNQISSALNNVSLCVDNLAQSAAESSSSILQMASSVEEISGNMETLSIAVEEVSSAIEEISATIRYVSGGVTVLSETSASTVSSVTEMDYSVKQVERNAADTSTIAEQVRIDAENGSIAVEQTIAGISEIRAATQSAAAIIAGLSQRAGDIGTILTVIDEVAAQTNLLALNAAIIAAQAGDHGKGFSVVATEIKDLSSRTVASTSQIVKVINGLQEEASAAVNAIARAGEKIDKGEKVSARAGEALNKIVAGAYRANDQMSEVARSTLEQAQGIAHIHAAMGQVAEMVEHFAKATREEAQSAELIMKAIERMKGLTFQVRNSTKEQTLASSQIAQSVTTISDNIQDIKKACKDQSHGSNQIVIALESMKNKAAIDLDSTSVMNDAATKLALQVDVLRREVQGFKV